MTFYEEPTNYEKTAISDLQGAWENLRGSVVEACPFPEWERLLFHIDDGMSWESMRKTLLLVQNIAARCEVPDAVTEWIGVVRKDLDTVLAAIADGKTA